MIEVNDRFRDKGRLSGSRNRAQERPSTRQLITRAGLSIMVALALRTTGYLWYG